MRVSTTTLESFRYVLLSDDSREAELVAKIKGEPFPDSWQARAGKAWHEVLEGGGRSVSRRQETYLESDGHLFSPHHMTQARYHIGEGGLWEVKATRVFDVLGLPVTVVAQADHVRGLTIQDNKTKFSQCQHQDYEQSLQWRFYLAVHGAQCFRYNLFDFKDPKDGYCELMGIHSFNFWPYVGLDADCREWLARFVEWAHDRKLESYLRREGSSLNVPEAA